MLTRILECAIVVKPRAFSNTSLGYSYLLFCLLLLRVGAVWAQSPAPLALPNLHLTTNGTVQVIAKRPDGGIVVGGRFSEINGVSRINIARLDATGALDRTWAPTVDGAVRVLAVDADDSVYAAGAFAKVNDENRSGLAKISGVGRGDLVAGWYSITSTDIQSLVVDGNGSLFIGGSFVAGSSSQDRDIHNPDNFLPLLSAISYRQRIPAPSRFVHDISPQPSR